MALIKEIESRSGVKVSYWKITDWRINQSGHSVDIVLTPYISNEARLNGYEPLRDEVRKVRAIDYIGHDGQLVHSNYTDYFSPSALEKAAKEGKTIYNIMYEYVKTHAPEFELAEDSF